MTSARPCSRFERARSELVDGSIDDETRETLRRHLAGCDACRADVVELRRVRDLLHARVTEAPAPSTLQGRLVSIAAEAADEPLRTRPFKQARWGSGRLPTRRRRRRRVAVVATAFGTVLVVGAGLGYAVAPASLVAVDDPTGAARSGFAAVRADVPLSSDPATAALVAAGRLPAGSAAAHRLWSSADPNAASPSAAIGTPRQVSLSDPGGGSASVLAPNAPAGRAIGAGAAASALAAAEAAAGRVGYQGTEQVVVQDGDRRMTAEVTVSSTGAGGSLLTVRADDGTALVQGSMPAEADSVSLVSLLSGSYRLSGVADVSVLGRRATVVEARTSGTTDTQAPTARWWVDQQTGLLLGRQTFTPSGTLIQSSMFTAVAVRTGPTASTPSSQLTATTAAAVLAPSAGHGLEASGWTCEQRLAGLPLTQVRTDDLTDPSVVHLVYTDGVTTLSVMERRGRLDDTPSGSSLDPALGAFVSAGAPFSASWQSGDSVLTVVTDGSRDRLAQAVHSLPHAAVPHATTMGRVRSGWAYLASLLFR
ncbi:negative regulator of sigma E activity/anti-sigma factor RsiW [Friedmanniella endophytica]|uniref:Negative regulator of sigma E activity/anti-sigma factor RsiW n=1 Tax=Microlunatus kandeliicorticis TaxID=1759536 RepID=A0A7W3ISJ9_9ACTN|nr:zf-HC2 domain-containing protein [Microlunatus kandeliicorticis]MBA8794483.1 negative regulator of sigma E activity/anti-sigma factor RsiW [Microlunatus kandeliicorticis]